MLSFDRWKVILTLFLCIAGIAYAVPNALPPQQLAWVQQHMPEWLPNKTVNLGLDLRGGAHLLLEADVGQYIKDQMEGMVDQARKDMREKQIQYQNLAVKPDGISFHLLDPAKDREAALNILRDMDRNAAVSIADNGTVTMKLDDKALNDIKNKVISQSIEIVRRRVDESGTKEPVIQQQGSDRIVVQLPGVDNPEHIKALLQTTAKMTFHLLDETAVKEGLTSRKLPMRNSPDRSVIIKTRIMVNGDKLTDARAAFDQNGNPVVSFKFDSVGAKQFCDVTRENVDHPFAIVLDKEVISAPVIREPICGGQGQISGGFDTAGANDLALLLRAGALPVTLKFVEERTVGPSLGSDSISAGKTAGIYAFICVFIVMSASYGLFGFYANIALALNMVLILAVLSILQATLTLPGIAGIILTIGIAVDANVLVYERIREELRQGRTVMSAIDKGYQHARHTIIDANVTTLIVAIILFSFGTGPVKGFAVSMTIGIITTIFCALYVTRLMIITWLRKTRPATLDL